MADTGADRETLEQVADRRAANTLLQGLHEAMADFALRLAGPAETPSLRTLVANLGEGLGALLLTAWRAPLSRPTMDIDLAGRTSNELDHIAELVRSVCETVTEPDGIEFIAASIEVSRIKEDADYEGVRVRFHATLARARIPMQIDIGFGDVIVPAPKELEYPTLLDFPAPVLSTYPRETVVAEKLEALTKLGLLNSRLKDYYDLALACIRSTVRS